MRTILRYLLLTGIIQFSKGVIHHDFPVNLFWREAIFPLKFIQSEKSRSTVQISIRIIL